MPRLTFAGGALIGCAAGFVNVPRIKGVHNAMASGMLAAEHVAAALAAGRANDELVDYENAWRASPIGKDLYPVRNAKPLWSKFGTILGIALGGFDMWCNTLGFSLFGTQSHAKPDRKTLEAGQGIPADRLSQARRQADLRPAVVGVPVQHQPRRGPAGPSQGRRHEPAEDVRARCLCRPVNRYCPAGVYEWVEEPAGPRFQINAQNCVHCKTCDIKDPERQHHLGSAGRRRRTQLRGDVTTIA